MVRLKSAIVLSPLSSNPATKLKVALLVPSAGYFCIPELDMMNDVDYFLRSLSNVDY